MIMLAFTPILLDRDSGPVDVAAVSCGFACYLAFISVALPLSTVLTFWLLCLKVCS